MNALKRSFYNRNTIEVANDLLGKLLVLQSEGLLRIGKIVEVEAYLGKNDLASHSSRGVTARTKIMFGPPGYAYVYMIYGMYFCMNVVTEPEGFGCAVLIRAVEPIQHISARTQGPGLLCKAMRIDKRLNGKDLVSPDFYIAESDDQRPFTIVKKPRIGVDYAEEWAKKPLRFYIKGNSYISKP